MLLARSLAACLLAFAYLIGRSIGGRCGGGSAGSAQAKEGVAPKTPREEKKVPRFVLKTTTSIFRPRLAQGMSFGSSWRASFHDVKDET